MDIIFAGGKFRAKSKFANIAKISSTRKIGVIQYMSDNTVCCNVLCRSDTGVRRLPTGVESSARAPTVVRPLLRHAANSRSRQSRILVLCRRSLHGIHMPSQGCLLDKAFLKKSALQRLIPKLASILTWSSI